MLLTKYHGSRPSGFRQDDLKKNHHENLFLASVTLICNWTRTICTILVEDHPRIICVKVFQNRTWGLGVVILFKSIVNGQTKTTRSSSVLNKCRIFVTFTESLYRNTRTGEFFFKNQEFSPVYQRIICSSISLIYVQSIEFVNVPE